MAKNASPANSMEQVRDLLLGTQLKDMENSLQRQEESLRRELADLEDSFKKRLESLEHFMKSETESLLARLREEENERNAALRNEQRERQENLKAEQRERAEALAQAAKDLAALEEAAERRAQALSGRLDATERELRQLLLSENARLSDKVDEKYRDALNALSKIAGQIRHDMASRSAVASLLTEMAVKLSGQWDEDASPAASPAGGPDAGAAGDLEDGGRPDEG